MYFKDSQGNSFPIDTSELQASTGRPAAELYTWEVRPIAEANARGSGVASIKGKMIDKPVVIRAQRLIALAEADNVVEED